jgi:hypothetical protein
MVRHQHEERLEEYICVRTISPNCELTLIGGEVRSESCANAEVHELGELSAKIESRGQAR